MLKLFSIIFRRLIGVIFILIIINQESLAITQDELIALPSQKYALCAGALSFNFDGITYAKCLKLKGNSVSLTQSYPPNQNIKTVNKIGTANNTYRVSTYSPPGASVAVYTCTQPGAFAQCDGGLCFESTSGKKFPSLGRLSRGEIICSCPAVTTDQTYHVNGPATCPKTAAEYDAICGAGSAKAQSSNGVILRVGAAGPAINNDILLEFYNISFGASYVNSKCERPSS